MSSSAKEFYDNWSSNMEKTKAKASDMAAGFGGMFSKIMADGAVTLREKELVALGIAVAAKCEPCIFAHVKKCLDAGNSPEQIIDAASVAVMMGGGPAFMHMTAVFDALEALGK